MENMFELFVHTITKRCFSKAIEPPKNTQLMMFAEKSITMHLMNLIRVNLNSIFVKHYLNEPELFQSDEILNNLIYQLATFIEEILAHEIIQPNTNRKKLANGQTKMCKSTCKQFFSSKSKVTSTWSV